MRKRTILMALVVGLVAIAVLVWPRWEAFWAVDACLDGGGQWDSATETCVK